MLQVINERAQGSHLQSAGVLQEAVRRVGPRNLSTEQAVLTTFHDLFRTGHLAWGYDLANASPPFFHLTDLGRRALANHSRDPANPDGYLAALLARTMLDPVTESYVREALRTFNADCIKAAAVMTGVAAESLVLRVRDALVARLVYSGTIGAHEPRRVADQAGAGRTPRNDRSRKPIMPEALFDRFEGNWPAFTLQIRAARNEAGHPVGVDPITPEVTALLIFPELATLATRLSAWISTGYT